MTDHTFNDAQSSQVRDAAIKECAKLVNEFDCHLAGYPSDQAKDYYESGVADTCNMLEDRIRALASQPSPAATVETKRETEDHLLQKAAIASGEVLYDLPRSSAATEDARRTLYPAADCQCDPPGGAKCARCHAEAKHCIHGVPLTTPCTTCEIDYGEGRACLQPSTTNEPQGAGK